MPALPLLIDPDNYRPCDWDLLEDDAGRALWLDFFEDHFPVLGEQAIASGYDAAPVARAEQEVRQAMAALREDPRAFGDRLDILTLDRFRDNALRKQGVDDPCRAIKASQSQMALAALPGRLREIDATDEQDRLVELLRGVLAGNLFDMGAAPTAAEFARAESLDFGALLARVSKRPWRIDDADDMRLSAHERVVIFADNAGADCILGMLPLAREFLRFGSEVVLVANSGATLNDVTAPELRDALREAAGVDPAFETDRLSVVESGTSDPLLDLTGVSGPLCEASRHADLVVLIGMGRAIESNWRAHLTCECWRLAVLKDTKVATRREAKLFDCIVRRAAPGR